MSVRSDQQRKGIGRDLIRAAELWARSKQLTALTLTTFRDVPWNAPFYRSCGFELVNPIGYPMLLATLEAEREAGLPIEQRCAMIRQL
jgi:GNAT superfamily N-acetyltransferase